MSCNSSSVVCSWYGNQFVRINFYILSQYTSSDWQQATKAAPKHTHNNRHLGGCCINTKCYAGLSSAQDISVQCKQIN